MALQTEKLGLFPLNVVLFPTALIPLHIFEERYKTLINECLTNRSEFGINFLNNGKISNVGCGAKVMQLIKRHEDGKLDVIIEGTRRFYAKEFTDGVAPYLMGTVSWLMDENDTIDQHLLLQTIDLYNELVEKVYRNGEVETIDPADYPDGASFKIAQKAGMDLQQRQKLLEINSEDERLQTLKDYLEELLPKVREAERVQDIIRNDGYLQRNKQ
ncbi:MAG TPA: LON peptidase substrate-binding domain-containing protein [Candidatus Kapabacteria bacterium]|nr:LON peptidase substrate-binding domain-containing protein [Candidatus Kapabacteria bacterium]